MFSGFLGGGGGSLDVSQTAQSGSDGGFDGGGGVRIEGLRIGGGAQNNNLLIVGALVVAFLVLRK